MSSTERLSIALPNQLTYTVVPDKGSDPDASYTDITFTNNDSNQVFKNLTIDGYCLDAEAPLSAGVEYTANVYSSYEELPDSLKHQPPDGPDDGVIFNPDSLDIINWIINQNFEGRASSGFGTFTSGDVQQAIWSFVDDGGTAGQLGPFDQDRIDEIKSLAQANGVGFSPSYDYQNYFGEQVTGKMAVILAPEDNNGDGLSDAQILIAEVELSKLGDRVWLDEDADGIQDAGEDGISGVTVNLLADIDGDGEIEDGEVIDTTTTDADGNYDFEVIAGDYKVEFEQPDGLEVSPANQGGDDSLDSDGLISDTVTVDPGEKDLTIDAGFYELGSTGGTIFSDDDGDGTKDAGEAGIENVTVQLTDLGEDGIFGTGDDVVIGTETTNADGEYLFEGLDAGNYQVEVTDDNNALDGLNQTADPDGTLDNSSTVTLAPGESDFEQDFGYDAPTGSTGGSIFSDDDGDGVQDAGEDGIAGVTVELQDKDNNNALNGLNQTADPDAILDNASMVTLAQGENNLDQDFGYQPANPGIDIEKFVNGEDADTAAEAVEIAAGDDAIFTYEVTNTGNVSFAANEVVVVDDNGTAGDTSDDFNPDRVLQNGFNVGDANQNNALDSGETWKYSKTLTAEDLSTTTTTTTNHVIDFDGFAAGTVIDDEYASLGVNISATGGSNQAMIFDSANPTGGDNDLRTPGNGINNTTPQGNILIISEDGDSSDPDDNARGGTITFDFDDGVNINSLSFVDIEENGGKVFTTDANGNVTTTAIPGVGDNSFQTLSINDDDVVKLEVDLTGSGSISSLDFDRLEVNTTPGLYTNIGTVTAGNVSDADAANYVNPDPITGYTYEAEDLQLHNYTVEHVGDFASGGEVIKLTAHEGSATVNFDGVTGNYDIVVGYYDENDGQSHAQVKIDGHVEASWTFNQDLGSNVASADNFVQYAIDDVNIEHGSDISLWASREHNEFGRFDYVAIVDKSTITAAQEGVQDELLLV